jgi:hypothetical protein
VLRSKQQEDELRNQKPQNTSASKTGSCFLRGIAFFGLFCCAEFRAILTPSARRQQPHDTSNAQRDSRRKTQSTSADFGF